MLQRRRLQTRRLTSRGRALYLIELSSRIVSIWGMFRLETNHLTLLFLCDMSKMNRKSCGSPCSYVHSSRASITRYAVARSLSSRISVKISDSAIHAFASSKSAFLPSLYLFLYVRKERRLLLYKQVDEAAQDGRGTIEARVGALAEEVG